MRLNLKKFLCENKGNIISSINIVLIFSFILVGFLVLETSTYINNNKISEINDNNFEYIIENYKANVPVLSLEIINETSRNIINNKNPLSNCRIELKNRINQKLNEENRKYYNNYKITIVSEVLDVYNDENPFNINVKIRLNFTKDDKSYSSEDTYKISVVGLYDPLPFLKCRDIQVENDKINYKNSLKNYLNEKTNGEINTEPYINGKSPLIIKECSYQDYTSHGTNGLCENCILNGYYHESRDGSCYLCRMEGYGNCSHYGFETFIVPGILTEDNRSIVSIDHVIFGENPYPGDIIILNNTSSDSDFIFLENGHKSKYGFI
ncbi:hypothetical protein [uncultured Methanobrevibacter sp.]|uniref:hypothetical protein n=1 Tax=uncultured Methanobrevibacter sp. TaxID=253161 RepID=UPI0025EA8AB7|nr:hypothetical protein [uncultured Methanobrevibacter sp.]